MPRPETPLDPAAGPVAQFALDLRNLRARAGLKYRTMSSRTHYDATTLSKAARGRRLASWPVVAAYVTACGADPAEWRDRWVSTAITAGASPSSRLATKPTRWVTP